MYILDFERIIVEAIKLLTMFRFENSDAFYLLVLIPMAAGLWYLGNNVVKTKKYLRITGTCESIDVRESSFSDEPYYMGICIVTTDHSIG